MDVVEKVFSNPQIAFPEPKEAHPIALSMYVAPNFQHETLSVISTL